MREVRNLREKQRHNILRGTEIQSTVAIRVDGVEYGGVLGIVRRQGVLQFLRVLVQVKVDAAILASCLVDEDVVEVVAQPLHANNAKGRNLMVDDVLPCNFALNHVCSDDVNDVVADVKELDEIVKLLLNQVLRLLIQLVGNGLSEVQSDELASG